MRRIREFHRKIRALRRKFDSDSKRDISTQAIRAALLVDLEQVFIFAKERLLRVKKEAYRQYWARIMGYLAQTITFIAREYDLTKMADKLSELQDRIGKLQTKVFEKKPGYVS